MKKLNKHKQKHGYRESYLSDGKLRYFFYNGTICGFFEIKTELSFISL